MPASPLLSLCAIFKDEERFLPEFISVFKEYCDELILVDTGSTDSSLEILSSFGISWFSFPWNQDFSAARNFALSKAKGRWILSLDIDERMCPDDLVALRALLHSADQQAFSPTCISLRNFDWKSNQPKIHSINRTMFVRIFPNHPEIRFEKPIHESIVPSLERQKIPVKSLELPVYHLGYAGELYQQKIERNKEILNGLLDSSEPDPTLVYYYTQTNWNGKSDVFETLVNAALKSSGPARNYLVEFCLAWLMEFPISSPCKESETLEFWEGELRKLNSESPMFWLQRARTAWIRKAQGEALRWYEKVYQQLQETTSIQYFRPEILYNFGFLLACHGKYQRALDIFAEFTDIFGADPHVFHQTLKLFAVTAQIDRCREYVKNPPKDLYKLTKTNQQELEKILLHLVKDEDPESFRTCMALMNQN